jgi:hypothetical protein
MGGRSRRASPASAPPAIGTIGDRRRHRSFIWLSLILNGAVIVAS